MKNNEKVPDYISRVILIPNEMKLYGEPLSDERIIVVAIENSKDLSTIRIGELQSSLKA